MITEQNINLVSNVCVRVCVCVYVSVRVCVYMCVCACVCVYASIACSKMAKIHLHNAHYTCIRVCEPAGRHVPVLCVS